MNIIDSHIHITPPEIIENMDKYRNIDEYFDLLSSSKVNENVTAEDVIDEMDKSDVDRAVVFGFGFKDMELCRLVNNYTIEKVNQFPDRLIGFSVVNPAADNIIEELHRCKEEGLQGVGELFFT